MINRLPLGGKAQQHTENLDALSRNDAGRLKSASPDALPTRTRQFSLERLQVSSGKSTVQCEEIEAEERVQYPYVMSPFNRA